MSRAHKSVPLGEYLATKASCRPALVEIVDARAGIEIDRPLEGAGNVDVAGGVGGDRLADVVAGGAGTQGKL